MLFALSKEPETQRNVLEKIYLSTLEEAKWHEEDIENILVERIDLLVNQDQLMVIFKERRRQEEADILALDKNGVLYIFELKRWESDRSNLLQVMRYGQIFGQYSYEALERLFRKHTDEPEANLAQEHAGLFEIEALEHSKFNNSQKFIIVTAGIDVKTIEAISYWQEKSVPLSALTYHIYKHGDDFFLDFHSYSPQPDDYAGLLSHNYIVNTNVTRKEKVYRDMLSQGKASAYYGRKNAVDRIQKGDCVFLYHVGVGVCAMGKAIENVQSCAYEGDEGEERYVPLKFQFKADPVQDPNKCVHSGEINQACGTSHKFRNPVMWISQKMADKIEELLKLKHAGGK